MKRRKGRQLLPAKSRRALLPADGWGDGDWTFSPECHKSAARQPLYCFQPLHLMPPALLLGPGKAV